jgi:DNA-binding NtrC family response regulator
MPEPLILIVDDELGVRESLKMVLGKGFRLMESDSVEAALAKVEEARPDLVLLDLLMPKSDGIITLRRIKEIQPQCGVIIMTGVNSQHLAAQALESGASDFIGKPFDVIDLRQKVARALDPLFKKSPRA